MTFNQCQLCGELVSDYAHHIRDEVQAALVKRRNKRMAQAERIEELEEVEHGE